MDAIQLLSSSLLVLISVAVVFAILAFVLYEIRLILSLIRRLTRTPSDEAAATSQNLDPKAADDVSTPLPSDSRLHIPSSVPGDLQYEVLSEILKRYHRQSLDQSRVSFLASLVFASLGFLMIASTILTVQRDRALAQQSAAVIPILAGAIINAVAGLFFVQSRRAQFQSQQFFDRLRNDRKLEKSLELAAKIADPEVQSKLQALLALHLAEVETASPQLAAILGTESPVRAPAAHDDRGLVND